MGRYVRSGNGPLGHHAVAFLGVIRRRKHRQHRFERALLEVGKIVAILHFKPAVEAIRQRPQANLDGREDLPDCMEAPFLLAIGPDDSIGGMVAIRIDMPILVGPHDTFVGQVPEETTGPHGRGQHRIPVIVEPGAMAPIVETVQKLGGHEQRRPLELLLCAGVALVMVGIDAAKVSPGVQHRPLLGIV